MAKSPSVRATTPFFSDARSICATMLSVVTLALGPSSHSMSRAWSPCIAAHIWSPTTATALSMRTTCRTPAIASVLLSSTLSTLPPNTGTCGDGRELHARHHCVDAELGLAVDLLRRVEPLGRRTDQREFFRRLEHDLVGHWQLGCGLDQRAVFQPLPGRRNDLTLLDPAGCRIDAPLSRGRLDQHDARRGAGAAQRLPKSRHRSRSAGNLEPEQGIGIQLVVRRRGLDADLLESHFEFLGDQHRHRRVGALAHLDLRHDERDAVVRPDAHKGIGGKGLLGNLRRSAN